ncbi:MAG TPA: two-component regulator propeller domain-containing protein [Blastocatellia bacterium]|nr:two-component regulator propeller domain-containing protein [Blastocatellia bacterium]
MALAVALAGSLLIGAGAAQSEGATISGVVQDDRGAPVADVKVTIASGDFISSVFTRADGKFEFKGLKPAQYIITAEAARFRKERVSLTIARVEDTQTPTIKLTPSSLHVAVLDAGNQPLGGVTVTLHNQDRRDTGEVVQRTTTDESGDAYFGRLAPGSYQLTAALRGFEEYRNEVFISPGITTEFPLRLRVAPVIPINEKAVSRDSVPKLPSKNVQAIFQDSEGWLWFGTDRGIARSDGSDYKSSAVSGSPYEGLSGEDVRAITEDREGRIWLATPGGVRRISKGGADEELLLEGVETRHLLVDSRGRVWVSTSTGLLMYDGKSFASFDQSPGLPSTDVRATAEDRSGKIWITTAAGVAVFDGERISAFEQPAQSQLSEDGRPSRPARAGRQTSRTQRAQSAPPQASSRTSITDVRSVFVDNAGNVWFATADGVVFFDGSRVTQVAIGAGAGDPVKSAASESGVRAISQDRSGRLWLALASGGATLYDPLGRQSQRITALDRDRVSVVLSDREGHVWFGTDNGAVSADFYSFVNFTSSRGLGDNNVRAVIEEPAPEAGRRGRLLFITAGGISALEGERFVAVDRFRAVDRDVRAVAFDRSGAIWFATGQGTVKLSGQTLTQFNEGNGLPSNNVHWVTSVQGGAAMLFATARGVSIYRQGEMRPIEALAGYDVRHAFEEGARLWLATARGLVKYDWQTGNIELIDSTRGLPDNDTRWIARFKDRLLIATHAGVQVYSEHGRGSTFTTFDGEPANTLFIDRDGYLWVGAEGGQVKKFALVAGHQLSTVYSGEVYALTGNRINSFFEDGEGLVWIATDEGVVRHKPVRVAPKAQAMLKVDDKARPAAGEEPYDLPYGRYRLGFQFTAVTTTGQVRYIYRINSEQGDGQWEVLPLQQGAERQVTRLDLDEGAHTFEVIALNRDLYGADAPAATLLLRVGSPFWKRWWFYMLAFALLGMAVAAFFVAHRMRDREYVLPKELRSYVAIEPNPYIVGNPIRTEKMFYGREDDFRYVRTKLEGANQGVVIVFCGERRAGKSSILYQVLNGRLGDRFIPVFVDIQEMVIASDSEFFERISRRIVEAIARAEARSAQAVEAATSGAALVGQASQASGARLQTLAGPVGVPRFDGRNPYPVFVDFLDEVLAGIGDRTLLILMDEYELIESKVDEGKLSAELFTFLAGLMDNKERLALIFTGSRRLEERDKKYWRELLRRSLFRKIGFLSDKDTLRLITEPVAKRVVYGRGVTDVIYRLTAGQPFYTQVICQNMVDYMNEHKQNWVTLSDLKPVIADIIDNPLPQMIYTWEALSDDEKLALSLLAEILPDGTAYATAYELRTSVKANEYPVNLSENTIRLTLEEMYRREILDKDASDGFRFKLDLFRLWIRRSHSIWQVVKEVRTL